MGDPSGVGPELILKSLSRQGNSRRRDDFLVIGSRFVLEHAASSLGLSLDGLDIFEMDNVPARGFSFGKVSEIYGKASYDYIKMALELIEAGRICGIVTSPISKEALKRAGRPFAGHTEILARHFKVKDPVMMLVGGRLRVALVTRHIPLKDVAGSISAEKVYKTIRIADNGLRKYFSLKGANIGVCGLNPHAGEGGTLGREEIGAIAPAIRRARAAGVNVCGPIPADAIFYDAYRGKYDCVIAMYHDQALAALKMLYRDVGVNITLGLPFIRTSPDHGTAFDIAGRGVANPESMIEALKLARRLCRVIE